MNDFTLTPQHPFDADPVSDAPWNLSWQRAPDIGRMLVGDTVLDMYESESANDKTWWQRVCAKASELETLIFDPCAGTGVDDK